MDYGKVGILHIRVTRGWDKSGFWFCSTSLVRKAVTWPSLSYSNCWSLGGRMAPQWFDWKISASLYHPSYPCSFGLRFLSVSDQDLTSVTREKWVSRVTPGCVSCHPSRSSDQRSSSSRVPPDQGLALPRFAPGPEDSWALVPHWPGLLNFFELFLCRFSMWRSQVRVPKWVSEHHRSCFIRVFEVIAEEAEEREKANITFFCMVLSNLI